MQYFKSCLILFFTISILSCSKKDILAEAEIKINFIGKETYIATPVSPFSKFKFTNERHHQNLKTALVTNDGHVIVADADTIKVWDYKNKKLVISFVPAPNDLGNIALSKDESYLYVCKANQSLFFTHPITLEIFDWKKGTLIKSLTTYLSTKKFKISPDNRYAIFYSSNTINIWDVENSKQVSWLKIEGSLNDAAISRDGKFIAVSDYNSVKTWELKDGKYELQHSFSNGHFKNVEFSDDNTRLICKEINGDTENLSIYDLSSKALLRKIEGTQIYDVKLSGNGKYCFTGNHYINLENHEVLWENPVPDALGISLSKNGKNAVYYYSNGQIDFYEEGKKIIIPSDKLSGKAVAGSATGEKLYLRTNNEIKGFDLQTGKSIIFQNTGGINFKNQLVNTGNNLVGQSCDKLYVWDTRSGGLIKTINILDENSYSFCDQDLSISERSSLAAFKEHGNLNNAVIYNLNTGQKIRSLAGFSPDKTPVILSNSGDYLIGQGLQFLYLTIWNLKKETSEQFLTANWANTREGKIALSADDKTLAVCTTRDIVFYDFKTLKQKKRVYIGDDRIPLKFAKFSPDGKHFIYATDKTIFVIGLQIDDVKMAGISTSIINLGFNKAGNLQVITDTELLSFKID